MLVHIAPTQSPPYSRACVRRSHSAAPNGRVRMYPIQNVKTELPQNRQARYEIHIRAPKQSAPILKPSEIASVARSPVAVPSANAQRIAHQ